MLLFLGAEGGRYFFFGAKGFLFFRRLDDGSGFLLRSGDVVFVGSD